MRISYSIKCTQCLYSIPMKFDAMYIPYNLKFVLQCKFYTVYNLLCDACFINFIICYTMNNLRNANRNDFGI